MILILHLKALREGFLPPRTSPAASLTAKLQIEPAVDVLQLFPEQADHNVLLLLVRFQTVLQVLVITIECSDPVSEGQKRYPRIVRHKAA